MEKGMNQFQIVMSDEMKEVLLKGIENQTKKILEEYRSNLDFQYVKKKELAELLSVSEQTINNWVERGLPQVKISSVIIFNIKEVNEWLNKYKSKEER